MKHVHLVQRECERKRRRGRRVRRSNRFRLDQRCRHRFHGHVWRRGKKQGSGRGTVESAYASVIRVPGFESSHRQFLFTFNCLKKRQT